MENNHLKHNLNDLNNHLNTILEDRKQYLLNRDVSNIYKNKIDID